MDIDCIVEQYSRRQLDAHAAFELLKENQLLAEAFMRVLAYCREDQAALAALCSDSLLE